MANENIQTDPLFLALVNEDIEPFNELRDQGKTCDFSHASFRGFDFRGAKLEGLNFYGAYMRNTDLRGLDLTNVNIEAASIREAKVSGTFFPKAIHPQEIMMSLKRGTRLRYSITSEHS